jgi:hypothetical protein
MIGSRSGSEDIWRLARDDFQRGDSARTVCTRYDLGKSTFWARASLEGWRRTDQPGQAPVAPIEGDPADLMASDLKDLARVRLAYALAAGRASEAAGWLKIYNGLREQTAIDEWY